MISKIKTLLNRLLEKDEKTLLAIGSLLSLQQEQIKSTNVNDFEFKIFSQFGDDGIIQYLIKNIEIKNQIFIEFGVEDYSESNTRFLMMNNNWEGLIMDGSKKAIQKIEGRSWFWKYSLIAKCAFITRENINELLAIPNYSDIGLLHIDIDGNDYHILEEINLKKLNPSMIIMEYNSVFGNKRAISVPYNKSFYRTNEHFSNLYFGASLPALTYLANNKGYALVCCNLAGNNAYYVRKDLLNDKVREISNEEAFKLSKFRESRDVKGNLSLLYGAERCNIIKGKEVINVINNKIEIL